MEISSDVLCLFSAQVKERDGSFVVEIPKREVELGEIRDGDVYRVALVESAARSDAPTTADRNAGSGGHGPPVEEGERRTVEIVDIGEQGDGIARVERGYVLIVPDTELRERVTVEIATVKENLAFGEVVERSEYYE